VGDVLSDLLFLCGLTGIGPLGAVFNLMGRPDCGLSRGTSQGFFYRTAWIMRTSSRLSPMSIAGSCSRFCRFGTSSEGLTVLPLCVDGTSPASPSYGRVVIGWSPGSPGTGLGFLIGLVDFYPASSAWVIPMGFCAFSLPCRRRSEGSRIRAHIK